jgi:hypothetical protein
MRVFIKFWMVLFCCHLIGRAALSYLLFNHVDLRREVFIEIIVGPPVQALILYLLTAGARSKDSFQRFKYLTNPLLAIIVLVDLLLVMAGWFPEQLPWADLNQSRSISNYYAGLKSIAGGIVLLSLVLKGGWSSPQRIRLVLFSTGLLAYGVSYYIPWLDRMPDLAFSGWPKLFQWAFSYGLMFTLSIATLLSVERVLRSRSALSAALINCSASLALLGAMVLLIGALDCPQPGPTPFRLVRTCSFLAMSGIWLSIVHLTVNGIRQAKSEAGTRS